VKLIACPVCHAQYDVSELDAAELACRCGETLANVAPAAVDAVVARCGSCGAQVGADAAGCDYCGSEIVRDPAKLSLICPECFARNADASRFCVACGIGFRPEPLPVDGQARPCPACATSMPPSQVAGIALNECPGCRGLWVPGDHFDALVRRATRAHAERPAGEEPPRVQSGNPLSQRVQYRRCPDCEHFMLRSNYRRSSGIILDRCAAHGTWLDADELEQVAGFILSGGHLSPALEIEHESAKRDAAIAVQKVRLDALRAAGKPSPFAGRSLLRLFLDILD
jgi:Zn-finger nucleic acid-binding protein/ribosomal protein L40E